MNKRQRILEIHGKTIYIVKAIGGWSLIIMPDEIVLDDYHGKKSHIHPNPEEHEKEIQIKHDTQEKNLNIIVSHINKNKSLIIKELIRELK
jgi:hypothetical protein